MAEVIESFTFSELSERLKVEKPGSRYFSIHPQYRSSHSKEKFYGEWDWDTAVRMFNEGWNAPIDEVNAIVNLEKMDDAVVRKTVRAYAGHAPNVAAWLTGQPKAMWRTVKTVRVDRTLNFRLLYMNNAWDEIAASTIKQAGQILAIALKGFERKGSNIALEVGFDVRAPRKEDEALKVRLKSPKGLLPFEMWAMPIMAPEFLRRICFHVVETCGELQDDWTRGYGRCVSYGNHYRIDAIVKYGCDLKELTEKAKNVFADAKKEYMKKNSFLTATDAVVEFGVVYAIMNGVYKITKGRNRREGTALNAEQMRKTAEILMAAISETVK